MYQYIRIEKGRNAVILFFILIQSVLKTEAALILTNMLNSLISGRKNEFVLWLGVDILIWCIWIILHYYTKLYQERTIQKMSVAFRNQITEQIAGSSYFAFHKNPEGTYISWLNTDVKLAEDKGFRCFYQVIESIIILICSAIGLYQYHIFIVLITLALSAIIATIPNLKPVQSYVQNSLLRFSKQNEVFSAKLSDVLYGYDVLFSHNLKRKIESDIYQASLKLADAAYANVKKQETISTLVLLINVISQLLVNLCTGMLILFGTITAGSLLTTGQLSGSIFNSLGNISEQLASIHSAKVIFEKNLISDADEALTENKDCSLSDPIETITFENVNYDYGNGFIYPNGVNAEFVRGGKYAIIGESGSGKSTLVNILTGKLKGYCGSIKISGMELKEISDVLIRQQIILMNQKTYLFNWTIKENILMSLSSDDFAITKILTDSGLATWIESLPCGLETKIDGNGINLSGGQKQRIGLARVLASGRKIIILDEGTNALDLNLALQVERYLLSNPDFTIILISHHLQPELTAYFTDIIQL